MDFVVEVPEPIKLPLDQARRQILYVNEDETIGQSGFPINWEDLYNLKGRVLTLCDASFSDQQQRKAFKDVLWQTLQHWMRDIEKSCGYEGFDGIGVDSDEPKLPR